MDVKSIETSIEHFAHSFGHLLKGFLHIAVQAAPIAAAVATKTGNADVVGDIEKAGEAAKVAEAVINTVNID